MAQRLGVGVEKDRLGQYLRSCIIFLRGYIAFTSPKSTIAASRPSAPCDIIPVLGVARVVLGVLRMLGRHLPAVPSPQTDEASNDWDVDSINKLPVRKAGKSATCSCATFISAASYLY